MFLLLVHKCEPGIIVKSSSMAEKNVCKLCLIFNIHKTQSFDAPLPLAFGLLEE